MKILAVIPARGGSKGIRRKNIRRFAGRPLLSYAIAHARGSRYVNRIVVSTESAEIARVAKKYGAEVPFLRPAELADDSSKIADAIIHLLAKLKSDERYQPDYLILLQPTSPLRTVEDIDATIQLALRRQADSTVTVCRTEQLVFTKDKHDWLRLESNKKFLKFSNRQQLPPTYKLDGSMVYVVKVKSFLKTKSFIGGTLCGHVIPRWRAIDLDEPQDFMVGELLYKNRLRIEEGIKNFT